MIYSEVLVDPNFVRVDYLALEAIVRADELNNKVMLLSARFTRINNQEHKNVISNAEAGIERNKINEALVRLIDELGK